MKGLKVQCPVCKRVMFETTDKFNPDVTPNGSFVRSLALYQIDWLTSSTTLCPEMTCPECLAPLAPKGRLTVLEPEKMPVTPMEVGISGVEGPLTVKFSELPFTCQKCGRTLKNKSGLAGHMRAHR
uniref:C2H2-type domain-containing protein n=1 Tax=viral metagenome TaxID=1070528 RepID=A0A6H1ZTP6_9ZZZZ